MAAPPRRAPRSAAVLALVAAAMAAVFAYDVLTPPDDVSLSFVYAVLILLTLFSFDRAVYPCAAAATGLSVLGAFINPPSEMVSAVFFTNRGIAVASQWIVAVLVVTRKAAEARLRDDLVAQKAEAETSRRFLDVLSHEIGTSLTRIDGQAFLLRRNAAAEAPADIVVRADKIRDAVRHVESVVQQIQLGSEAGERAMDMTPAAVNLRELVEDVVLSGASEAVAVETELAGLPESVWADPGMLRQILDNVLANAVKYSRPGGAVRIRGGTESGNAVLSVADQGRGIPADEQERVFTPYYRARNSRGVHGAGIGLYVARRFVESHGGTITVDSAVDAGTTVTIRLPVEPAAPEEGRAAAAHPVH